VIAWVYILLCSDGRYYVGSHRGEDVAVRVEQHQAGIDPKAYTYRRRPVRLMWAGSFQLALDAIAFERQVKGWRREKKEALIRGEFDALPALSKTAKDARG
jgi:putative endonuclease